MIQALRHYGYPFFFLAVLAECLGLPVPSFPFILVGAALAAELHFRLAAVVGLSVSAALAGDCLWYLLGRRRGRSILRKLCSLSLNVDSCVGRTEDFFARNGLKALLIAKFIPGLSTVASPLAGMLKMSFGRFVLFDLGGVSLWVMSAVLLGVGFRAQVEWLIGWLAAFGRTSALVVAVFLAGWLLLKWFERRRFYRLLERSRISPQDLKGRLAEGEDLVIVDLRSDLAYQQQGSKIPGAIHIPPAEFRLRHGEIPKDRPIVMYCTCPNEATSARLALLLKSEGYKTVWPLLGGMDAWLELGYPTEAFPGGEDSAGKAAPTGPTVSKERDNSWA